MIGGLILAVIAFSVVIIGLGYLGAAADVDGTDHDHSDA